MEAHRFTAPEALEAKLVDEIAEGDSAAVFDAALNKALKLSHLPRGGVYGLVKVCRAMCPHHLFTNFCVEGGQWPGDEGD
jgi:hypothetical protein